MRSVVFGPQEKQPSTSAVQWNGHPSRKLTQTEMTWQQHGGTDSELKSLLHIVFAHETCVKDILLLSFSLLFSLSVLGSVFESKNLVTV